MFQLYLNFVYSLGILFYSKHNNMALQKINLYLKKLKFIDDFN